jgi:hypothetical protein
MAKEDATNIDDNVDAAPDQFEVPQDLTGLSDTDLAELSAKIDARGAELATLVASGGVELSDDDLAEAEALAEVADEFAAEFARRAELAADKAHRANAALSKFSVAKTDDDTDALDDVLADDADTGEFADDTNPYAEDGDDDDDEEDEAEMSARPATFRGASPAFLRTKSKAASPRSQPTAKSEFMVATEFARVPSGTVFESPLDVARAIQETKRNFGNVPAGTRQEMSVATGTKSFDADQPVLTMDPQSNLVAMRDVQQALVASGECCTPQTQLYDFFRLAQPIRDVEDAIPTVQAPRGGIRYIQANCTIQGADAVGFWDCDDSEAALTDPTVEKPCDRVTCPEIAEVLVEAITQCTLFDNLQYRTFPELIENFMEDVAVQFTLKKQRFYLDGINAASTVTTGIGSYGAARSLMYDLMIAAVGYRKRHHMPRGSRLQVLMPDWAVDLVKADLFNDGDSGLDYMNVPDAAVVEALNTRGLDVTFYYDDPTATLASNPLTTAQLAGPLNDFGTTVTSYMYAPGTFVKLDGGTLDLGLVRDHQLNKKNDFAMFMEEWIGLAQLGCESIRIDSTVCPSGARPGYADELRACAAS